MSIPLRVLLLEDRPADAELVVHELRRSGFDPDWYRIDNEADLLAKLDPIPDVILSDYFMPPWDGLRALHTLKENGHDIPFIIVSGTIGEDVAVECIRQGAADYLLKDRLGRLGQAVNKALADKSQRTERKRVEAELLASEIRYRRLFETAHDGILILDANTGQVVDVNPYLFNLLGYSSEDLLGKELWEIGSFKDILSSKEAFRELQNTGFIRYDDLPLENRDGRRINVEFVSNVYLVNGEKVIQCNIRDITKRRQAEKALEQERHLLRTLIDHLPDRIYAKDTEGRFTLKNEVDAHQMGASSTSEVIGKTDFDYYPSELATQYYADDKAVIQSGQSMDNREEPFIAADGSRGWMLTSKIPLRNKQGNVIGLVGIGRDITDRMRSEERVRKLNRTLALLSEVNKAIVRIRPISLLFDHVCRIAVDVGGFQMAWIGLLDGETKRVNPVASVGLVEDYLEKINIVVDGGVRGQGPTGRVVSTGEHIISDDIEHDPHLIPWREDALKLGYRSSAAFPLKVGSQVRGVLTMYATKVSFFDDEELKLLDEMAADISFAMEFAEQEARREQAETALRVHLQAIEEMRVFLQTTMDAFPANTVVLDPDGTILNVNQRWIEFGDTNGASSPVHYLAKNYLTVCDTSTGPDSDEAASAADCIRAVIDGSRNEANLEYPCHTPPEQRWFAMQVTPFPEPAPRRVVVAHINITDRKQAELRLQEANDLLEQRVTQRTAELQASSQRVEAILNNSPEGILLLDTNLRIRQTNPAFNNLFGILPDEYLDKPLFDLVEEPDAQAKTVFIQAIDAKPFSQRIETRIQRKDNTVFDGELSVGYVPDGGIVCIISDITIRKQAEATLKQALTTEKELGELKSRFVSMASHEFRTPLATIFATTETLSNFRHKLAEDQIEQKLDKIRRQVGFLTNIMDDVLNLAKLQARRYEFNPEHADLNALCQEIIAEFQSRSDITHDLQYTCEIDLSEATFDKKLMRQIVSNLLSNAIKYSPSAKSISIKLEQSTDSLMLSVQDSEIGISDDDLKHLFEPFHRGANVGSIHGTGLGLIITKEAVELHGGTITVASEIGTGTTFTVRIPGAIQGKSDNDQPFLKVGR